MIAFVSVQPANKHEPSSTVSKQTAVVADKLGTILAKLLDARRTLHTGAASGVDEDSQGRPVAFVEATVVNARDLPAMKKIKASTDAYVAVSIEYEEAPGVGGRAGQHEALMATSGVAYKTQTCWDSRHPRWDHTFSIKDVRSRYGSVRFSVMDNSNTGHGRDVPIGFAVVSLEELLDQKKHR